jgi:hypothetical protein
MENTQRREAVMTVSKYFAHGNSLVAGQLVMVRQDGNAFTAFASPTSQRGWGISRKDFEFAV